MQQSAAGRETHGGSKRKLPDSTHARSVAQPQNAFIRQLPEIDFLSVQHHSHRLASGEDASIEALGNGAWYHVSWYSAWLSSASPSCVKALAKRSAGSGVRWSPNVWQCARARRWALQQ